MDPDRIADYHVRYVAHGDPGNHEESKQNIAEICESEVFWAFRKLQIYVSMIPRKSKVAYREEDINHIHNTQNQIGDFSLVITVTGEDQ